jgi:hypothetical protein
MGSTPENIFFKILGRGFQSFTSLITGRKKHRNPLIIKAQASAMDQLPWLGILERSQTDNAYERRNAGG